MSGQPDTQGSLTEAHAKAVYDVLMRFAGASEHGWEDFVLTQTASHCEEYRFIGSLGFGGKFWRDRGQWPDGSHGERWRVSADPEDTRRAPEIEHAVQATNQALTAMQTALCGNR